MTPRQVMLVGIGQCISWGILYYAFGVLLLPVSTDLGAEPWQLPRRFRWRCSRRPSPHRRSAALLTVAEDQP